MPEDTPTLDELAKQKNNDQMTIKTTMEELPKNEERLATAR